MKSVKLIQDLSNAFGPSGFEDEVAGIVKEEVSFLKDLHQDTLLNVTGSLSTDKQYSVMLDAHMDEVGIMVQAIKPNGTMQFVPLGGWNYTSFPTSLFQFKNNMNEKIEGVIASTPVHFSKNKESASGSISDLLIDIGATSSQDVQQAYHMGIGNPGVPSVQCRYDESNGVFMGKAFDCRIGVAALIETLKRLKDETLDVNVKASFSTQEEVGCRGVEMNVNRLKPTIAICFEGTPADDTFSPEYLIQAGLKKGCMIRHIDGTMIAHPKFVKAAVEIAEKYNIPCQQGVRSGGGTNASVIHKNDVPTIVIGVPVRYLHTNHCYCALSDFNAAVDLAVNICKNIDDKFIESIV